MHYRSASFRSVTHNARNCYGEECILDRKSKSKFSNFVDKTKNYESVSKTHVPRLAMDISEKLRYIRAKGVKDIELIGHSIGAHAAGQAARRLYRDAGYKVDRIIGLDPAGKFFKDNSQTKLKSTDAANVTVFHTNADYYGLEEAIGPNDIYIKGGKKQPECKRKLTENICSHNRGWDIYIEDLQNAVNKKNERRLSNRFVLCIDVSSSMDDNNRLIRAINAGKKLLSNVGLGSYIGIVIFSEVAEASHKIIQINSDNDRNSLISKLPQHTISSTSIGAGLQMSMLLLRNLTQSDELCSTIILLSDGGENTSPYVSEILPQLQNACIGVNSIALGATASDELEKLSLLTDGSVVYAMEKGKSCRHRTSIFLFIRK